MSEKLTFTTEIRTVDDLVPCDYNPREMTQVQYDQLRNSLLKFDYVEMVVINRDDTILAGHQRIKVMKDLGWGHRKIEVRVPCRMMTQKEFDEYLIRSNKNSGKWDWDLLSNKFSEEHLLDWGFEDREFFGEPEMNLDVNKSGPELNAEPREKRPYNKKPKYCDNCGSPV